MSLHFLNAILLTVLFGIGCTKSRPVTNSNDVVDKVVTRNWTRPTDCRENIKKAVCVVGPSKEEEDPEIRPCLGGEDVYVALFENLYDHYPPAMQKMFCSMRKLFIEKEFVATAYAGRVHFPDGTSAPGAIFGVRKSLLDANLSYGDWASWKEQLNFGGRNDDYTFSTDLPYYNVKSHVEISDFLYLVVAHEFGHFFDFANQVNDFGACRGEEENCPAISEWSKLSWETSAKPLATSDFAHRSQLCFYNCKQPIASADAMVLYQGLEQSDFISSYGSTNPWDDFAEVVSIWAADKYISGAISIHVLGSAPINIINHLHSVHMKLKKEYVENLMASKRLTYP